MSLPPPAPGGMSAGGSTSHVLKASQLAAVTRMLTLPSGKDSTSSPSDGPSNPYGYGSPNNDSSSSSTSNPWKILIYDKHCRSIISPLLSVSELRALGVTLHLLLDSDREPIPDVPAVYFIRPTQENLTIVARDCQRGLYSRCHLHFSTRLDRTLMEEFARLVVNTGGLGRISSVHDQFVDFCSIERGMFALNFPESYAMYNDPRAGEVEMERAMDGVADGLFSVVATLGAVPVIRCPRGGAPEMVARKLTKLIAQHPTLIHSQTRQSHHRPVLVIMDRNMDLLTPVQHTSTYQALIDDVLDHKANRVEFTVKPDDGGEADAASNRRRRPAAPVRKKLDIDPDVDPFYSRHKFHPFPEAIESNGNELQDVTNRESLIRSKTAGGEVDDGNDPASSNPSSELATAVDSLPVLLERKKKLEVHTSVLQAVMNEVAARDVPQFYELETSLATGSFKGDAGRAKREVLELAVDPAKGNVDDKVRLVLVYALSVAPSTADIDEVAAKMRESLETRGSAIGGAQGDHAGGAPGDVGSGTRGTLTSEDRVRLVAGMRAVEYLKKLRSMQMITITSQMQQSASTSASTGGSGSDMLSGFMSRATNQATGLLAKATDRLGTMLGTIHKHRATLVVENICEMRPGTEDDDYLYLDPRARGTGEVNVQSLRGTANRAAVREAIAFMIGGGCYGEYQNLQMVANERRSVTYGSTEIVDPCKFVGLLGKLAV